MHLQASARQEKGPRLPQSVCFPPIADITLIHQTSGMPFVDLARDKAQRGLVTTGALLAGLAVLLGAFGAHALKTTLGVEALGWWHSAVEYQMWHALAVVGLGLSGSACFRLPALLLAGGAIVFSGTLYALALGAPRWFGAVTPIGGAAMIAGWALLAWRSGKPRD